MKPEKVKQMIVTFPTEDSRVQQPSMEPVGEPLTGEEVRSSAADNTCASTTDDTTTTSTDDNPVQSNGVSCTTCSRSMDGFSIEQQQLLNDASCSTSFIPYDSVPLVPLWKPNRERRDLFICGPLPLIWLQRVSMLDPRTSSVLAVGLELWHLAGIMKQANVPLGNKSLKVWNVSAPAKRRALAKMQKAGLIKVVKSATRCPLVTIITDASQWHPRNQGGGNRSRAAPKKPQRKNVYCSD